MKKAARILAALLVLPPTLSDAMDLSDANGLIDFDSAIGFTNPRTIQVFRSTDPGHHLYFMVPNSVRLAEKKSTEDIEFSLFYSATTPGKEAYVTFSLEPILDNQDIASVVKEIKSFDASEVRCSAARFVILLHNWTRHGHPKSNGGKG
jgi:hypothetical protein